MYPYDNDPEMMDPSDPSPAEEHSTPEEPKYTANYDPNTGAYIGPEPFDPRTGAYRRNTDSGFSDSVPPSNPPKKQKNHKKHTLGLAQIIALCLVCAILGGCVSGGTFALINHSSEPREHEEASSVSESSNEETVPTTGIQKSDRTAAVETKSVAAGEEMSVSEIYEQYSGSVVCVEVSTASGSGAGTGFVITEDGYIATCYHVIDGATDIAVTFSDSTSYEATLVGGDEDQDIAVLKIDAKDLKPVVIGDSSLLKVGDSVTTIGNALGTLANTTTTGVVSALDRAITMSDGSVINVMQTDCTVNSGNSGGPLFNQYGEVIGIVNAKYSSSSSIYSSSATIEGIGFAIPYADITDKIVDLMEYGYITGKPYLGISVSTVSALEAQKYNLVVGAYVTSVETGSCAETAGLQKGDIICNVDGSDITTYEELVNAKNLHSAGDEMKLKVYRDGSYLDITVTLDEQVPATTETTDSSDDQNSQSQYDPSQNGQQSYNQMTPEEFYQYFFGNRGGW